MKLEEAKKIVTEYQLWRRGDEEYHRLYIYFPYSKTQLGKAIDTLLTALTVTDEMVGRGAKAIHKHGYDAGWFAKEWEWLPDDSKERYNQMTKAALNAALYGGE